MQARPALPARHLPLLAQHGVQLTPKSLPDELTQRTGGTGQALRIACHYGIPILNLARPDHHEGALAAIAAPIDAGRATPS